MDKIGAYTNTADASDEFTEGDPSTGTPATEVDGGWLNAVQRELVKVIQQMGLTLSDADDTLLWQAVQAIYGKTHAGDPNGNVAANVVRERCWDTSTSPPTLYIATAADGTTGGTTWTRFTDLLRAASTTQRGVVELATNAETQAGTDSQRAVHPAGLASALGLTGALVPLAQASAANDAAIDFTAGIDSTYDSYLFVLSGLRADGSPRTLQMRTSDDGGSVFDGVDYEYALKVVLSNDTETRAASGSSGQIELTNADATSTSTTSIEGTVLLPNPLDGNKHTQVQIDITYQNNNDNTVRITGGGSRAAAEAVNAIRFEFGTGNIAEGTIRMYGVKKS